MCSRFINTLSLSFSHYYLLDIFMHLDTKGYIVNCLIT